VFAGTLSIQPWLAAVGLVGIVITAALFLRMLQRVFLGGLPDRWREWRDLSAVESAALTTLLVVVLVIGVVPVWLLDVIDTAANAFTGS
jgi:NADH-quinone oxidoreductase subunit M